MRETAEGREKLEMPGFSFWMLIPGGGPWSRYRFKGEEWAEMTCVWHSLTFQVGSIL